jgi:hypothetical protein
MLVWPILFAFGTYFTSAKDENGNDRSSDFSKAFKLNIIAQLVCTYASFYVIYYTTEIMKSIMDEEVMSGHIFAGLLSTGSFMSTTVFIRHFRDKSNNIHKVLELICFLYVFHMAYSFFWTAFIFHSVLDSFFGLVMGLSTTLFVQ